VSNKVLFVDDDPNILASYRRTLRKQFDLESALGGAEGLEVIEELGPFAVIVADMRMPGMDGIQFLGAVKQQSRDSVRMMLTGNADQQTAVEAVNKGNIFRFLTKPCPPETMAGALHAGIRQYQLVTAERQLLEETLRGSVKVFTDILGLVNPGAFSRGSRISRYVRHVAQQLQLADVWQFELAAMLSQLGCIALPPEVLDKVCAGRPLSDDEARLFSSHPSVGSQLVGSIPRLEIVARMIEGQERLFAERGARNEGTAHQNTADMGAQILKAALDFDQWLLQDVSPKAAVATMRTDRRLYNPQVLDALESFRAGETGDAVRTLRVSDLARGMVIDEDIRAKNGVLLVAKGQEVTPPVLARLRAFAQGVGVAEPFRVRSLPEDP